MTKKDYLLGAYEAVDPVKGAAITDAQAQADLQTATTAGKFSALGKMAMFPAFTFICYLALIAYFRTKGGYKPVALTGSAPGESSETRSQAKPLQPAI